MDDIERIEVIRGPGSSLWGANAVNGVINVITKHSKDTLGSQLRLDYGTHRWQTQYRHGMQLDEEEKLFTRIYGSFREFDDYENPSGASTNVDDDWNSGQAGFRMDYALTSKDNFTLSADVYETDTEELSNSSDNKGKGYNFLLNYDKYLVCLLYTSPSPRD